MIITGFSMQVSIYLSLHLSTYYLCSSYNLDWVYLELLCTERIYKRRLNLYLHISFSNNLERKSDIVSFI